jgi:Flp pilus assembly protein TadD
MQKDEKALKDFASRLGIQYHILDPAKIQDAAWLDRVTALPLTVFIRAGQEKMIDQVLAGGGATTAHLLATVAENLFRQRKEEALALVNEAAAEPNAPQSTTELKGYILTSKGRLDEAQKEFEAAQSTTGLAKVALERGTLPEALALAEKAPENGYAQTVKATALAKMGKLDLAESTVSTATAAASQDWQKSEALNLQGRLAQESGNLGTAIQRYGEAAHTDPYNVVSLANEGAARRANGDLEGAKNVLEQASRRGDTATAILLKQVSDEIKQATDTKRAEVVRAQIEDLGKRYRDSLAAGSPATKDQWSSRPLVVALLPSTEHSTVFFDRAGMDTLVQRELETRLQASGKVSVVERDMLDKLLQELNLGSSEITSADTQRRLGQVLSAGVLGFLSFVPSANGVAASLRLVDTETTAILAQVSAPLDENNPEAALKAMIERIVTWAASERELKGLIADCTSDDAIMVNVGARHGVTPGMAFTVLAEGAPVEVGGRVVTRRQEAVGRVEVTQVEPDYAVCKVVNRRDGASFAKEMKVKALKAADKGQAAQ